MKIQEIKAGATWEVVAPIIGSFSFSTEKIQVVQKNFQREILEIGSNRVMLLGKLNGSPVSTVQLVLENADNNPELANGTSIAHVHSLWVRREFQRRGLAEKTMRYCEELARLRGFEVLTLGVDDSNKVALSLYRKLGYATFAEEAGRSPAERLLLMRKFL